jgi:hypothetical protein
MVIDNDESQLKVLKNQILTSNIGLSTFSFKFKLQNWNFQF